MRFNTYIRKKELIVITSLLGRKSENVRDNGDRKRANAPMYSVDGSVSAGTFRTPGALRAPPLRDMSNPANRLSCLQDVFASLFAVLLMSKNIVLHH